MTESSSGTNPLALVIEDHKSMAKICRTALENVGFTVEVIQDGQLALDRLATLNPAVILLDLHLPNVSGPQILHYIRTHGQLAKTPIILTSADLPRVKDLQYEVEYALEKPFGFAQLYDIARELYAAQTAAETGSKPFKTIPPVDSSAT